MSLGGRYGRKVEEEVVDGMLIHIWIWVLTSRFKFAKKNIF